MLFHPFKLTTSYAPVQVPIPMTKQSYKLLWEKAQPNLNQTNQNPSQFQCKTQRTANSQDSISNCNTTCPKNTTGDKRGSL